MCLKIDTSKDRHDRKIDTKSLKIDTDRHEVRHDNKKDRHVSKKIDTNRHEMCCMELSICWVALWCFVCVPYPVVLSCYVLMQGVESYCIVLC